MNAFTPGEPTLIAGDRRIPSPFRVPHVGDHKYLRGRWMRPRGGAADGRRDLLVQRIHGRAIAPLGVGAPTTIRSCSAARDDASWAMCFKDSGKRARHVDGVVRA